MTSTTTTPRDPLMPSTIGAEFSDLWTALEESFDAAQRNVEH